MSDEARLPDQPPNPHYRWPWFVLGAVLLAILLAVLWMSWEIQRTKRIRDLNSPPTGTRSAVGDGTVNVSDRGQASRAALL